MTNAPERKLVAFTVVFTVIDVGLSLEFYRGRLGFRESFRLGDPPNYAIVERDAVSLASDAGEPGGARPRPLEHLCVRGRHRCAAR